MNTIQSKEIETSSGEKPSSLLNISIQDLLQKLPQDVIQYLAKDSWKYRARNIYIVSVSGLSYGGSEHEPVSYYQNTTIQELPHKIMNDRKLEASGLFHALINMHQEDLKEKDDFRETLQTISDLDEVSVDLIQKLYLEVLQKPEQILTDMEDWNYEGTCYYYCFEEDLYFKHLRKELLRVYPNHRLLSKVERSE